MTVRFDHNWTYHGFQALILENTHIRAVVLPQLGAKIWSLILKPADREFLWHNPRLPPRPAPYGSRYDDWFCGGWDELFPNDAPVTIGGEPYPDHGELWSMPFTWDLVTSSPEETTIRLHRPGVVTTTHVEKWITLRRDESQLHLRYIFENTGPFPLDFLWKLHPALAISPASRIDLPARRVIVCDDFPQQIAGAELIWPHATDHQGKPLDLRRIPPPTAATAHFYYAVELSDGWCALTDTATRTGFGLAFDSSILSTVWVFGAYGGWRGHYTTILEPCTGYPYNLEHAIHQRTCTHLPPNTRLETTLTAVLYQNLTEVHHITRDGNVTGATS